MSIRNLNLMFQRADKHDREEGMLAYQRYHAVMMTIANKYGVPLPRIIAGFVSLSPNSDYIGNLRSLISVCEGMRDCVPVDQITVSTYKHCRDRAALYLSGQKEFITNTTGQKILNFYHNVLDPFDPKWVTIDGHMVASWRGKNLTMKEAIIRRKSEYHEIGHAAKQLAFQNFMLPNQYQAIVWFARKRYLGVRYDNQTDIFFQGDVWRTAQKADDLRPYPRLQHGEHPGEDVGRGARKNPRHDRSQVTMGWGYSRRPSKRVLARRRRCGIEPASNAERDGNSQG